MKKQILLTVILSLFITCIIFGQTGEKKSWSSKYRADFISDCINTAKNSMGIDTARFYCYCMQEKIEIKYPTPDDADKITAKDMSSPEWQKEIKSCLYGSWTSEQREEFISNCVNSAKEGMSETKAENYCGCMLFKMEKIYPNADDVSKLREADFKSDYWKKIIKGCLDF